MTTNQPPQKRSMQTSSIARLRAIIETSVEGIITIDRAGIVQSFNPAAEKIFSYEASEVIGENVNMLMPAPYHQEHETYIDNYLAGNPAKIIGFGREVEGKRKCGSVFPIWLSISEFKEKNEHFFTGFIQDLSVENKYKRDAASYEHILENIVK